MLKFITFVLKYWEDFMIRTLIMGAIIGLVGGIIFSALYFGPGQLTTPMAYIHDVSGALLGILIAWIVGLHKRSASAQK
jgi:membrane associated rhomboid family serine protease